MSIFRFTTGMTGIKEVLDFYNGVNGPSENWIFRFWCRKSDGEIATAITNNGAGREISNKNFWNNSITSPQTITSSTGFPVELLSTGANGTLTHLMMRAEYAGSGIFLDFAEGPFSTSFDFPNGYILRITSFNVLIAVGDFAHSV